jgi:hypothetical protein
MTHYKDDPHWIAVRYPGQCAKCKKAINRGETAFYYPRGRTLLCKDHGKTAEAQFHAEAADEDFISGRTW